MDIVAEKEIKEMFEIKSYPTHLIFKHGVPREFKTHNSPDSLIYEMRQSKKSPVTLVDNRYDLERLTESDKHIILGVFDNEKDKYIARYGDVCTFASLFHLANTCTRLLLPRARPFLVFFF